MNRYRLAITGSRAWDERDVVEWAIESILREQGWTDMIVVHGGCRTGADAMADGYARSVGLDVEVFKADWQQYGRAAGPIRNRQMLLSGADELLAFIRNNSTGASGTVEIAKELGIPYTIWRA